MIQTRKTNLLKMALILVSNYYGYMAYFADPYNLYKFWGWVSLAAIVNGSEIGKLVEFRSMISRMYLM